jgi:hypothetical protein
MANAGAIGLGSLVSVWRYPVKSMLGEELNAAEVTERGLLGDRAYALVDSADGKAATAKNPRKWPRLFDFRAAFTEPVRAGAKLPPVRITLPDGTTVMSDQGDLAQALSKALAREVTFRAAQGGAVNAEEYWPDMEGPGILRTAAQHNRVNVGVYAAVTRGGTIRRGDPITIE